ncbi:uncharacterized protein HMPREF1541_01674 [Cyphellophora europaea CBS 101466]|uniref:Methyltransferase domain-containing protein n=1 Tax=Cyphellophora europaea (strain CBS 101466) TaxID=1220924 RepID=W2S1G0_CYPE1|nr:uncharacterized protein HMPREF1541_01674 [Cyphellophora europaea CBS 101466]ETN42517.1 hypothetical protein HMPREF1541_01674 [Cyphellophora europaea CBS 101466]
MSDEADLIDVEDRFKATLDKFGRTYQTYSLEREINLAPVDDEEGFRLEQQHDLVKDILGDALSDAWPHHGLYPSFVGEPRDVLDCGFGTASWCAEVAEYDPDCLVIGLDIALHLATDFPENCSLEIADLNETITLASSSIDFVHSRFIAGGLSRYRWPGYLSDLFRTLRDGGWIQLMEWDLSFRSNNGEDDKLQALREWTRLYYMALDQSRQPAGKRLTQVTQLEDMLRTARFQNVSTRSIEVPTCGWDSRSKKIGEKNLANMQALIEAVARYPVLSRGLTDPATFEQILSAARAELALESAQPFLRL